MAEVCAVHAHTKSRYGCASYYRVRRITLDQRLVQIAVPQCRHVSTARNGTSVYCHVGVVGQEQSASVLLVQRRAMMLRVQFNTRGDMVLVLRGQISTRRALPLLFLRRRLPSRSRALRPYKARLHYWFDERAGLYQDLG